MIPCDKCGYTVTGTDNLMKHIASHHNKISNNCHLATSHHRYSNNGADSKKIQKKFSNQGNMTKGSIDLYPRSLHKLMAYGCKYK